MGEALITRRGGVGGTVGYRYLTSETLIDNKYINFSKDCILLCHFATTSNGDMYIEYNNSAGSRKTYSTKVLPLSALYSSYDGYYFATVLIRVKFTKGVYTLTSMHTGKVMISDARPGSLHFFSSKPTAINIIDL